MIIKLKNKGISYIEFILVLTIMVLLTGLATVTMSIVNRNNVTKGADRVVTGINHAKTLSLSKGSNKGSITFVAKGSNYYYYYGDNDKDTYLICSSPCSMRIIINGTGYNITNSQKIRLKISQTTGSFVGADRIINGTVSNPAPASSTDNFGTTNAIEIKNNHGKTARIDLNIHAGTTNVTVNNN